LISTILLLIGVLVLAGFGMLYYRYHNPGDDGTCLKALAEVSADPIETQPLDLPDIQTRTITKQNVDQIIELERVGRGYVREVFWSPQDDLMVLTTVGLWQHNHDDLVAEPELLWMFNQYVDQFAISPDRSLIVILRGNGEIPILDAQSGDVLQTLAYDSTTLKNVAINSDNTQIAAALTDKAQVWDIATGELLHTFDNDFMLTNDVAFSPDDTRLAVGGTGHDLERKKVVYTTVDIWELATGEKISNIDTQDSNGDHIAFNHDGTIIATADAYTPQYVRLWDIQSSQEISHGRISMATHATGEPSKHFRATFSSDGQHLLYGYQLWQADLSGSPKNTHILRGHFNHTGTLLAGLPAIPLHGVYIFIDYLQRISDEPILIWDVENGRELLELPDYYGTSQLAIADQISQPTHATNIYGPNGVPMATRFNRHQLAIVVSNPHDVFPFPPPAVRLCDDKGHQLMAFRLSNDSGLVNEVVISPDERYVAISAWRGVHILNVETHALSHVIPYGVNSLAFSSDSTLIAASYGGYLQNKIRIGIWDWQSKQQIKILNGHTSPVQTIRFADDDSMIVSYGQDGTARFWGIIE